MAMPVRECQTARSQQEGTDESERDPQQEDQLDTAEGKDTADYDQDVDYEGSEPKVKTVAQDERDVDPDAEYAEMEILHDETLHQRMVFLEQCMEILRIHRAQGPQIMASKLQDMYIQLGFSPESSQVACQRARTRQS